MLPVLGLADVDIYGPSLPVLVKVDDQVVRRSPLGSAMILPLQHKGVKMISLGFVSPNVRLQPVYLLSISKIRTHFGYLISSLEWSAW
jgi:Mrp family chromosome partitioning ATPase